MKRRDDRHGAAFPSPADQVEKTDSYEGFIHLTDMSGDVVLNSTISSATMTARFLKRKGMPPRPPWIINRQYGRKVPPGRRLRTYYNMREKN